MMFRTCPSCGLNNNDDRRSCICGHYDDGSHSSPSSDAHITDSLKKINILDKSIVLKNKMFSEEFVVKETNSWVFTFSQSDKCLFLGTPALQSFRLKITVEDLEELLEFMYQRTAQKKTIRKLQLSLDDVSDLIDRVDRKIEEKKFKVRLKLSNNELEELADLINMKLKD